jgi:hypothetical protein
MASLYVRPECTEAVRDRCSPKLHLCQRACSRRGLTGKGACVFKELLACVVYDVWSCD